MHDDPLHDFACEPHTLRDETRNVWVGGVGPAVVVLTEMPGISPHVARFARWVRDAGFTVFMPSLFGRDGAWPEAAAGLAVMKKACVTAEFGAFARHADTPISRWLRALAKMAHARCGGPGVGAVGMCFTGNFALSMLLDGPTIAPVLCQPSLPLDDASALQLSGEEASTLRARLERESLFVRAYRFEGDRFCTAARFAAYQQALGPRFEPRVLPDSAANRSPPPFFRDVVGVPHSVVTAHLIDEAGQPTLAARDEILGFLRERLAERKEAP